MATNNSRQSRREALKLSEIYAENYRNLFFSLFDNSIIVEGLENYNCPKRYLLKLLIENGGIAYDKETGLFLRYTKVGIDVYGLPREYTLVGANGYIITRKANEVVILRANDYEFAISQYLEQQIQKIVELDLAISQNLEANKTMTLVEVPDQATLLSITNEATAKRIGSTIFYRNSKTMEGVNYNTTSTGAKFLGKDFLELRKAIYNETISVLGISTANTDKRERVQSTEVMASNGLANDFLNILIDTFNYDSEYGNLGLKMKGNTTLHKQILMQEQEIKEGKENE